MTNTLRPGDPAEAGMSAARVERIRGLAAGWVEQGLSPAIQLIVARHGIVVVDDAWGRDGPEPDARRLTPDSIFGIGSMSKPITAAAVMCLVEDGLLGLNRPVQEYVPEFVGEGKEAVLVHHLLTHTSGLRDDVLDAYALDLVRSGRIAAPPPSPPFAPDGWPFVRCFEDVLAGPLATPPGAEMSYSSYAYRLLAEIVDRVAGMPAEQHAQERVFGPLGMHSTSFTGLPPERRERLVRRPPDAPFPMLSRPEVLGWWRGMGAACSSASDLAIFAQTFLNGGRYGDARVLSRASVREMTRNQIPGVSATWAAEYFPEACWGYGWNVVGAKKSYREPSLLSPSAFNHSGVGMIFVCGDPELDLVVAYASVGLELIRSRKSNWCADLVIDAACAAIDD